MGSVKFGEFFSGGEDKPRTRDLCRDSPELSGN